MRGRAWGFTYKTMGFVGRKVDSNGRSKIGPGNNTRPSCEVCLLAGKGKGLKVIDHAVQQYIEWRSTKHSKKPREVYRRIERLYGPSKRLELFARDGQVGWDAWGNQITWDVQDVL